MFERMTSRTKDGIAYTKIPANESNMVDVGGCYTGRIVDRIAAYEDIGKSPEEIISRLDDYKDASQLKEAKKLIGKTVYCVFAGVKTIMEDEICGFEVNADRVVLLAKNGPKKDYYLADISAVGKTVFLSREEAEKALQKDKKRG